jgi:hypothetical protein
MRFRIGLRVALDAREAGIDGVQERFAQAG